MSGIATTVSRLRGTLDVVYREMLKFGAVGAVAFVIDVGLFNLLVTTVLDHKPITSKAISTVVAATSSYFMNRHWTWKDRARTGLAREYAMFIVLSAVGLAITLGCLAFGEYVLNQHSLLARNFWGNIVGVAFGMVWRFWSFKRWVFLEPEPDRTEDAAHEALV